jgi:O-antigen/teichoic acid export membrane protein
MMIRRFLGPEEVAWYGLAYKIYGVLVQPAYYLVSSIFPLLSSRENNKKLFLLSTGVLLSGGIMVMLGTWILAPLMINVLAGSEFAASVSVLRILAVALVFSYLGHIVGFTLISKERQKEMLVYGIVAMLFNFSANLVVIPSYGIIGAAWVTVLTELISMLLMASKLRKRA